MPKKEVRLLSRADLREQYGITYSRSHLWTLIQKGAFPAPVQTGIGDSRFARKAFRSDLIEAWIESRRPAQKVKAA
jgi:predicted DNA-binding transcriptional regulator AlpA